MMSKNIIVLDNIVAKTDKELRENLDMLINITCKKLN